jgi:hypothetical protein
MSTVRLSAAHLAGFAHEPEVRGGKGTRRHVALRHPCLCSSRTWDQGR